MLASQKPVQEWCVAVFPSPVLFAWGMNWFALICRKADVTLCGDNSMQGQFYTRDSSALKQLYTTILHCWQLYARTTLHQGQLNTIDNLHCWPIYTEDNSTPGTYLHPGQLWTSPTLAGIINQMANWDH